MTARVLDITRRLVRLQSGFLYHYAFAMLIGAALVFGALTWLNA
jgi:NADH-quinone oxidoreductase subunit L